MASEGMRSPRKVAEQIGKADHRTMLFRVSDDWAAKLEAGWSEPVRLRLQRGESFYYELVCEAVPVDTCDECAKANVGPCPHVVAS